MKAAIINEKGQSPVYGEIETPKNRQGMLLIHVKASALSPLSKVRAQGNHYSSDSVYPMVPGAEGVGVTTDNQRVYFFLPEAPYGAFAEQSLVREDYIVPIPDELDDIIAAAIANPGMSSWAALVERAKFQPNETVLINGATGTSGRLAVQIAKHLGAKRVIATGRNEQVLQELLTLGADAVIPLKLDGTDEFGAKNLKEALKDQFNEGIDVVIDYLWGESAKIIMTAVDEVVDDGHSVRFVNCGASSRQENIEIPSSVFRSSAIELMGSGLGSVPMPKLFDIIGNVFEAVKLANLQVDTNEVPLSSIEKVWDNASGKPRVVFTIH